jgi:hypothetical protein
LLDAFAGLPVLLMRTFTPKPVDPSVVIHTFFQASYINHITTCRNSSTTHLTSLDPGKEREAESYITHPFTSNLNLSGSLVRRHRCALSLDPDHLVGDVSLRDTVRSTPTGVDYASGACVCSVGTGGRYPAQNEINDFPSGTPWFFASKVCFTFFFFVL